MCQCNADYTEVAGSCQAKAPAEPDPPLTSTPQSCKRSADGNNTPAPIIPATGEKYYTHADYTDTGPYALSLERSYRSRWSAGGAPGFAAPVGLGVSWAHNHSTSLQLDLSATPKLARVLFGSGSTTSFTYNSTTSQWESSNSANRLEAIPSGYKLTLAADDSRWYFDASGKLQDMALRNGHNTHYTYSDTTTSTTIAPAPGYLIRVINSLGRSLSFTYTSTGQLSTVATPDGQTIRYQFDGTSSTSRLSSVSYPGPVSGTVSKTYHYEDNRWPQSVTGFTDERGIRVATVVYDTQGRAVESGYAGGADYYKVTYPQPELISVNGGPSSYVTPAKATVTDPLGTVRTYNYGTTQGKLAVVGADKPSGTGAADAASRVQNAFGLVEKETDFLGIISTTTWDTTRRLPTASTQAVGLPEQTSTTTTWHPTWSLPTQVVESGRTTDTTYYPTGNVKSETITDTTGGPSNGEKRTWSWTYTAKNLVETQTDPLGNITRYTYNSAHQRTSSIDPLGNTTTYSYDSAGRLSTITEPNGLLTTYTYDPRSRVRSITTRDSTPANRINPETTSYTYTAAGQLETITEPSGVVTTYSYDNAQRLIQASDNRGNTWVNTLDGMGNATRQDLKDSNGTIVWTTSRSINALNRVASITNASGQSTTLGYDANGSLTSQTDALTVDFAYKLSQHFAPILSHLVKDKFG